MGGSAYRPGGLGKVTGVGARSGGVGAEVGGQERPQRESQQEAETDGRGRQELKESESTQGSWLQPVGANENRRKTCLGATESKRGGGDAGMCLHPRGPQGETQGPRTAGRGCTGQEKARREGTRCSEQDRSCRKEKDYGTLYALREKCVTPIILSHLGGVSGTRRSGQIPPPLLTCCVTWNKSLNLSGPWFLHLQNGGNNIPCCDDSMKSHVEGT